MFLRVAAPAQGRPVHLLTALVMLIGLALGPWAANHASTRPDARSLPDLALLPLAFEANAGQADPAIRFTVRSPGGAFGFAPTSVQLTLTPRIADRSTTPAEYTVRLSFVGADPAARIDSGALLPGRVNYLLGSDPAAWKTDLPTYGEVHYTALYPGVDLTYTGTEGRLKGTYTLAPGTDPTQIRWRYSGAEALTLDAAGNLQITAAGGACDGAIMTEARPLAWQEIAGQRVDVPARYDLAADGTVGFALGAYDRNARLTVDPYLSYATYFGGIIADLPQSLARGPDGSIYVTGYTASSNFPVINAYQPVYQGQNDAFVARFSADGTPIYSTYLGGNYLEAATGIAVDSAGNIYVTGWTGSTNFPTANAFQPTYAGNWDVFVTKLNPSGNALVFSTFLGGSAQENYQSTGDIAVDSAGNVYVDGDTQSTDFPTHNAYQPQHSNPGSTDLFVTKFDPTGQALVYSTYLGGSNGGEYSHGIATDAAGNTYVTGETTATNYPTHTAYQPTCAPSFAGCWDVVLTKFNPSGSALVYSTFLGGNDQEYVDRPYDVAVDQTGNAYITGFTGSPNFPVLNAYQVAYGGQVDVFVSEFSTAGSLLYSTFLGGDNADVGGALALDPSGSFYVGGQTLSRNFPLLDPIQAALRGSEDGFVTKFKAGGQALGYSTYLGGSNNREEYGVVGIATDGAGGLTLVSSSSATDFPVVNAYQPNNAGSYDVIIAKIQEGTPPTATGTPPTPTATPTGSPTPLPPILLYSTYYGAWERDSIQDIGRDAAGNIYVMGTTFQQDIDYGDIYVAKFSPDGHTLLYRTILGGTRIDYGYGLSVDAAGNATAVGIATSFDYPVVNAIQPNHALGIYDGVVTKLNSSGSIIFSTYLGGSGTDYAQRVATDGTGNVYIVGNTNSTDFPITAGVFQPSNRGGVDGYITKLTANGSAIAWSTYLGGVYADEIHDIALDGTGNLYLTGFTASPDYPLLNAFQGTYFDGEAFVTKMNPQGTALVYSTYLGGNNPPGPGEDNGQGIVVDATGAAYVTGYTQSPNFPVTAGAFQTVFRGYYDAFVTKLTPAGNALVYSTFVGGAVNPPEGDDEAFDIAVDGAGQAHITGKTNSPDFPVVRAVQPMKADVYDVFVTKLNASGSDLVYSTFLGGHYDPPDATGDEAGEAILIDGAGNAVIGGSTGSFDFPIATAYQPQNAGESDGFISKLSGSNPLPTSTPTAVVARTATATAPPAGTPRPATPTATAPAGSATPGGATATPCAISFSDVYPTDYFYEPVRYLYCHGVISGYADGTFRPYNETTRSQMVKIVVLGFGLPVVTPAGRNNTFADVPPTFPFYTVIETAAANNIVSGYTCGGPGEPCDEQGRPYFRPYANVTRGQLSKIAVSAAGWLRRTPVTPTFSDVPPGSAFYTFVETAVCHGVVSGYADGTFRPTAGATRGQISKIVSLAITAGGSCAP
jgi:S-layer homology domain/Beta-propeller repeat